MHVLSIVKHFPGEKFNGIRLTYPDSPETLRFDQAMEIVKDIFSTWVFTPPTYNYLNARGWMATVAGIDTKSSGDNMAKFTISNDHFHTYAQKLKIIAQKEEKGRRSD